MPQEAWNAKRERQYEHIKDGLKEAEPSEEKAQEIAARTVNKERARGRRGEGIVAALPRGHLLEPSRRAALGHAPREGPHARPALQGGEEAWGSRAARR